METYIEMRLADYGQRVKNSKTIRQLLYYYREEITCLEAILQVIKDDDEKYIVKRAVNDVNISMTTKLSEFIDKY